MVHSFAIVQKKDKHVLEALRSIFGINAKVQFKSASNSHSLETSANRSIVFAIDYFANSFIGMKAVEYRIWSQSYIKHKGNFAKLVEIQTKMRNLKSNVFYDADLNIITTQN
jgi:hypothetical protein